MGTLRFALLSVLEQGPRSGYDLAQTLDLRVSPFWHARHSQIYPELAVLEREGLVEHRVLEQSDRPDKKLYTLKPSGHQALVTWLTSPIEPEAKRDELVLRALSIGRADRAQAIALFRNEQQRHREREALYRKIVARLEREHARELDDPESPFFGRLLTLQRGIGYEREYAAWCKAVVERLEASARKRARRVSIT
jgi:DNA-binding PadR family transcriptional regulator